MEIFTDMAGQIGKLPIAILLGLALIAVGMVFKWTKWFDNRFIPLVVLVLGALGYAFLGDPGHIAPDQRNPQFVLALYGIIIGFVAWGSHKLIFRRLEKYIPGFESGELDDACKPAETITTP